MEATGTDKIPAPDAEQLRSEYGSQTPKKRPSSCSAFAQSLNADSDAGYRQMLLEGRTASPSPPNPAPLYRCSSLPKSPAEIQRRTRRPLFASPANQSLPPVHPLIRTASDPIPFSYLENTILPNQEKRSPAPRGSVAIGSGLDSSQEAPSSKRAKRIEIHRIRQQVNQLLDEMAIQEGPVDDSTNVSEIAPTGDHKVVNCNGGGSEVVVATQLDKELKEEVGTVSLERIGDWTHVEFTCQCGSGFSLRIIGHDFFYKLS